MTGQLHELLLPRDVGCRDMAAPLGKQRRCPCECECTTCLFLHDHAVTGHVRYSGCAAQAAAAYLQRCRDLAPWLSPLALRVENTGSKGSAAPRMAQSRSYTPIGQIGACPTTAPIAPSKFSCARPREQNHHPRDG